MDIPNFTIIDDGRITQVAARVDGDRVGLSPAPLHAALGWELKPQGLCKDDRCVPVTAQQGRIDASGADLAAVAALLGRPLAIDVGERVACLGTAAADRAAQLASLAAPDFTLPDLDGRKHSLSDYRGKKVLLVAYASW
jgi:AhpC/TSA family protein